MSFDYWESLYGFYWGGLSVDRACSDEKYGVVVSLNNGLWGEKRKAVEVRMSPGGRVLEARIIGNVKVLK